MDACYGGLAVTRSVGPGSSRFLKDMLQRYSRQVITAGKADETVSDSGGPLPEHSIFTGHLLDGLLGKAASLDGTITANGIMSYVYDKVSKDTDSYQTPHFGFLRGDGDFIFAAPILSDIPDEPEKEQDVLVEVPMTQATDLIIESGLNVASTTKEYIADQKYRIKLDDLAVQNVKKIKALTSDSEFPVNTKFETQEEYIAEITTRLRRYESAIFDLQQIVLLLGHWGNSLHIPTLTKIMARMTEWPKDQDGTQNLLHLRWYPTVLLMYSGGIGAMMSENYQNLSAILNTNSGSFSRYYENNPVIIEANIAMTNLNDLFKKLPGHERNLVPQSEYLFKVLQPVLDDLLYLGTSYEEKFDRFEIFQALSFTFWRKHVQKRSIWGPLGRFAWKHNREPDTSSYTKLLSEAKALQQAWLPLKAGFFNGSYSLFEEIAEEYNQFMLRLNWF
jgi:hypothetical protein